MQTYISALLTYSREEQDPWVLTFPTFSLSKVCSIHLVGFTWQWEQETFVSKSFHMELFETYIKFAAQKIFQAITWTSMKHTFASTG